MLPHFVWQDFLDVLADLRDHGFDLRPNGSRRRPNSASPSAARSTAEGVQLELRQALEPWHVLGETGAIGGTVRYTDSSTERLQVKLTARRPRPLRRHLQPPPVPLTPSPGRGRGGGRALQGVAAGLGAAPGDAGHAPLTFDIFDTWTGRALGGCVYHVAHPGGRNYDTFPVNGNEAEARRLARFEPHGHSPGLPPRARNPASRVPDDARPAPPPGILTHGTPRPAIQALIRWPPSSRTIAPCRACRTSCWPEGAMRPVWRRFIAHLAALTPDQRAARFARGDQYLRDAGVFYRQYGEAPRPSATGRSARAGADPRPNGADRGRAGPARRPAGSR
jgi:hypothetical protein